MSTDKCYTLQTDKRWYYRHDTGTWSTQGGTPFTRAEAMAHAKRLKACEIRLHGTAVSDYTVVHDTGRIAFVA